MLRRLWPWLLIFTAPAAGSAAVPEPVCFSLDPAALSHERRLWTTPLRISEFSNVPHTSSRPRCEENEAPQALTTPDPLLIPAALGKKVKVSFIIGADGRVHSPLILESAGPAGDRNVLQTVRSWRYRPATCNGVPTETEGKIEFSRR
jgi:TonB family protein